MTDRYRCRIGLCWSVYAFHPEIGYRLYGAAIENDVGFRVG